VDEVVAGNVALCAGLTSWFISA